jgi:hypothetical protein
MASSGRQVGRSQPSNHAGEKKLKTEEMSGLGNAITPEKAADYRGTRRALDAMMTFLPM